MSLPKETEAMEPIAIVGMAMRFPGASHSSEQFWQMLSEGRSAHKKIPKERFDIEGYYHPDAARAGSINVKGGYFLSEDPVLFDAPFFSMTALEASGTDPQQRLMLEVAYEALENAGIPIQDIAGTQTSVYVGCFTKDFEGVTGRDPFGGAFYAATGYGSSMLSNRVSWFFDLRGPSVTVDTACSSSLYAVHLACQSLRLGESKMAIIGGTNLIYDPSYMRDMCWMTFLSPDGICHSFDHRANGYARGDGIGGMILKTLKQAVADGDTIRAIIRNSGLGQDGRTPGITMPSPQAHADLILSTYAGIGLSLDETSYFEAHGTGTSIGDPYELSAIGATFGKTRGEDNPIYVGSVKTNIGHLEGCAGLAGLIKAALVVERGQIPPLAGFEKANPRLRLEEWRIALPETLTPWPTSGTRRASVNSFGYGGANAHVIVDDAYHYLQKHDIKAHHQTTLFLNDSESDSGFSSEDTPTSELGNQFQLPNKLFVFSSADQAGLSRLSNAYSSTLDGALQAEKSQDVANNHVSGITAANLAYTLGSRRSAFDHRTFVVCKSITDLNALLQTRLPGLRRTAKNNNVFFIFTGQGAQWASMGKELIGNRAYRQSLETSQECFDVLGCKWSIQEELFASDETSRIDSPDFSQPLCTALQIALVDLLNTWGIQPKSVVGHSSGEIAAAYATGAISHHDAIKIAYFRGKYSADVNNRLGGRSGAMIAVGLSDEAVVPYLHNVPENSVVVACINAPNNVTLSGDESSINQLLAVLTADGIFVRRLRVKTAYHSPHVIAADYLAAIGTLETPSDKNASCVIMFSSVTAASISAQELQEASYWVQNMISTVRFSEAVKALISQNAPTKTRRKIAISYAAAIEIGPAAALQGPLVQILTAHDDRLATSIMYTSLLSRGASAEVSALNAAGKLWAQGLSIDLYAVNFQATPRDKYHALASLPPYPWNHTRGFGHQSAWGKTYRYLRKPRTDLLGLRLRSQDKREPRWQNFLRLSEQPWMADHRVQQMILYPGAAMVTMAIQAAHEMIDSNRVLRGVEVRKILFRRPLFISSGDTAVETAIHLRPVEDGSPHYSFRIFSQAEDEEWQENCSGLVSTHYVDNQSTGNINDWDSNASLYAMIRKRATRKLAPRTFYKFFDKKMNLQYGPLHQNVSECVAGIQEGHGKITIPDTKAAMPSQFEYPHLIHPATLDSIFHMQALGYLHTLSGDESLVPVSIESIFIAADISSKPGTELDGYSKSIKTETGDFIGDIVLSDESWLSPKAVVRGFLSRDIAATNTNIAVLKRQPRKCTTIQWEELDQSFEFDAAAGKALTKASRILILCREDEDPDIRLLAQQLSTILQVSISNCAVQVATTSQLALEGYLIPSDTILVSLIEMNEPFVARWTETELGSFKDLASRASAILWITRGGDYTTEHSLEFSATTGLLRTLRVEMPQLKLPHLNLPWKLEITKDFIAQAILKSIVYSILSEDSVYEQEFAARDGKIFVPRLRVQESFHQELSSRPTREEPSLISLADLRGAVKGVIERSSNSIAWQRAETPDTLGEYDLEVKISAISLHPTDIEDNCVHGVDAIGIVFRIGSGVTNFTLGDSVVICASQTMRTSIVVNQDFARHVPAFVDPNLVVTLPSALCTAQAALLDLGRLQPGETVVIAAISGSIEQALVSLARQLGANVFVKAQDAKHEEVLMESLGIDEDHILRSSTTPGGPALADLKEVALVVTTLNGGPMQESMCYLSHFGRFVSIGRRPFETTAASFSSNIAISNFDLEHMRSVSPRMIAGLFKSSWDRAAKCGLPLASSIRTFPLPKIEAALAFLHGRRCFGSAVLKFAPDHQILTPPPKPAQLKLDPSANYILAGGLGGIGRSIADMMFEAGARNISFLSRSGAKSEDTQHFITSLLTRGCNAEAIQCDIADPVQVQLAVARCQEQGKKIKGLVQCAMVLRDSMFENMTFKQWSQTTEPKIQGSLNLHKYMPDDLDFFIMLSSMAGVIGNPGQANYSAAGTYQDALSLYRRSKGLPSMTIDLGIVSEVGYISENPEQFERLDYLNNLFISERDIHLILAAAMLGKTRDGAQVPAQLVTGVGKELLLEGSIGSAMTSDLKYIELHDQLKADSGVTSSSEDALIKENLRSATSVRQACTIIEGVLASQLARALNMEAVDVDLEKPMHAFGVDSLVAVEIRNIIFRRLNADISVFDILSMMPLVKLAIKVASKSGFVREDIALLALDEVTE
ncbi:ketoacyl-synt-domain-containing protein [Hyaloscypha hepaticicola]|uniref:Ketoacyl-synt-domain-containing protein n=1 Tax=Hyaloscypha hepaticicola TaxID=2082293 RepID=A0A2J6QL39_9HELO|nr:ketoacyl-synt-domain-containing protein [Hyaloscypha hepaticicola]